MPDGDKLQVVRLFATMVLYVGAPEYFTKLQETEYNFEAGRNFFQNILMVKRARAEAKLTSFRFGPRVTRAVWRHSPSAVSGHPCTIDFPEEHSQLMGRSRGSSAAKHAPMIIFAIYRSPMSPRSPTTIST